VIRVARSACPQWGRESYNLCSSSGSCSTGCCSNRIDGDAGSL